MAKKSQNNFKKRIVVTGLRGVIGSVLKKTKTEFRIVDLNHQKMDLLDTKNIRGKLELAKPDAIIHLASVTHIDACESDKKNGKEGIVWKVNVEGTHEIAKFCAKNKIPLIFLSTECVFDGRKEFYSEYSSKKPINWYGTTKHLAEEKIIESGARFSILRSVVAYHINDKKRTIYGKFLGTLESGHQLDAVVDQFFTPTYAYDIARAINQSVKLNLSGIFHVSSNEKITPYDFAVLVANKNNIPVSQISKVSLESFYDLERASLRLKNASLLSDKSIKYLKFIPKSAKKVLKLRKDEEK